MEDALRQFLSQVHWTLLAIVLAGSLAVLAKAADWLVSEVVALSERSRIPKVVIGATIVSLATTTPEAVVSVLAAMQGSPGLALGNAVGSIICDTGLILGLISVMSPLRLDRKIVNRQGWVQLGAALALVAASFPWASPGAVLSAGGKLPQAAGLLFLLALAVYVVQSIRWTRDEREAEELLEEFEGDVATPVPLVLAKLLGVLALVVGSAQVLVVAAVQTATRLHLPDSVIAATIVAFGTSLPELVTAVTAARRGHGELALGTVIGADILNVLFVAGTAAAVTPAGLQANGHFFLLLYPIMVSVLVIFRLGVIFSGDHLKRPFGLMMLGLYGVYVVLTYLIPGT